MKPRLEPITAGAPHDIARSVMLQGWHDLTALHWRYEPAEVQALLPEGFVVDTFDGSAWVGLIPFRMRRIRLPGLPQGIVPWEYTLAELLGDVGYRSALFGKWHLGDHSPSLPNDMGFDSYFGTCVPNWPPFCLLQVQILGGA